jgi:hypothetical protein
VAGKPNAEPFSREPVCSRKSYDGCRLIAFSAALHCSIPPAPDLPAARMGSRRIEDSSPSLASFRLPRLDHLDASTSELAENYVQFLRRHHPRPIAPFAILTWVSSVAATLVDREPTTFLLGLWMVRLTLWFATCCFDGARLAAPILRIDGPAIPPLPVWRLQGLASVISSRSEGSVGI